VLNPNRGLRLERDRPEHLRKSIGGKPNRHFEKVRLQVEITLPVGHVAVGVVAPRATASCAVSKGLG